MILSAKALSTFHIHGKYYMQNGNFNLLFHTITTMLCLVIKNEHCKKVLRDLKFKRYLQQTYVCRRKLQDFREHVNLTSYITILSVWFGLLCNFFCSRDITYYPNTSTVLSTSSTIIPTYPRAIAVCPML